MGEEGRNDLGSLTWCEKVWVRGKTVHMCHREYHFTSNFHTYIRQLNYQYASFPVLLQNPNETAHTTAVHVFSEQVAFEGNGQRIGEVA